MEKMGNILFSITVDDRPDLLRRQIENLNHFCPNSFVCVHLAANAQFTRHELSTYVNLDNIIVNPLSYEVLPKKGCLHAHVSNFRYAIEQGVDFDKILLCSPNELLLRHGLSEHLAKHALGTQIELFDAVETFESWSIFREETLAFPEIEKFLSTLGLPVFAGGQAEGQFFNKTIFQSLERIFLDNFPLAPCGFPSEQIVPATIAMCYGMNGGDVAMPITFIDHSSHVQVSDEIVSMIQTGKGAIYAPGKAKSLRPIHIGSGVLKDIFAISCTDSGGYDPWEKLHKQASEGREAIS